MGKPSNREEALAALRATRQKGDIIVGAGAGIGLSAKSTELGGVDLIIIYNSGRYRMAGRGSLAGLMPYGNANDVVLSMASEVLPVVKQTPVLAGVCASDPFRGMPKFITQLRDLGFAGVQNFPTVGLIDKGSVFRQNLEETGMGYDTEVELVREARRQGLLTTPYVFDEDDARQMAEAGADLLVAHMGLTTSGSIGAKTTGVADLDGCVEAIRKIQSVARQINPEILVLCHGGPIATPEDARYVLARVDGLDGFYGASSMERLPVEDAIAGITREFKGLKPSSSSSSSSSSAS